jgi:hypothetical protein
MLITPENGLNVTKIYENLLKLNPVKPFKTENGTPSDKNAKLSVAEKPHKP